jgi:GH25 family lysozyme M1 (1,4-beta-N-acetylmuramidase)
MTLFGIDVSHWQGTVDWGRARAAGVRFGFAKATEGTGFVDSEHAGNVKRMRGHDVIPGAYHFLTAGSAQAQADHFAHVADPGVIHALDVEAAGTDPHAFAGRYREHYPSKALLIYTGRDLWARSTSRRGDGLGPLWVAGYRPNAYVPGTGSLKTLWGEVHAGDDGGLPWAGWTGWAFMQFTDKATVPGVAGPCDGDAFAGTIDQLRALMEETMPLTANDQTWIKTQLAALPTTIWGHPNAIVGQSPGGAVKMTLDRVDADNLRARVRDGIEAALSDAGHPLTERLVAILDILDELRTRPAPTATVDVEALAAALAPHLPPAADPAAVAVEVADVLSARLAT